MVIIIFFFYYFTIQHTVNCVINYWRNDFQRTMEKLSDKH